MTKSAIYITIFLLLVISVSQAGVTNEYNIQINLIRQEPDPVEPGKDVEISFKIDNQGKELSNFIFEILPEYPFTILPGEPVQKEIGLLPTTQQGKQTVILKYKLKISQDAIDDTHELKVRYKKDKSDSWATISNFTLKVQTQDAILAIEKFSTSPVIIAPGEKAKLKVELKNYASSILKNIRLTLNLDKTGDETPPLNPLGTSNERVIPYIEPKATLPIDFEILVSADSLSKAYKLPLSLKYTDSSNKNYSKTNLVTIVVGDKPEIGVSLERTEIFIAESTGLVVVRVVNKGNPDIKFLNVKLNDADGFKVIGANEAYIGKLESDDFSTAEFKIFVDGKNKIKLPIQITYKDANNKNYIENKEVELKLYSNNEAKRLGLKKDNNILFVVIVLIGFIGVGYYYIKKKKRHRQKF